jgi:hypothetical protein
MVEGRRAYPPLALGPSEVDAVAAFLATQR